MTNDSTLVMAVGERNPEFWAGDLDGGVGDRVLALFRGAATYPVSCLFVMASVRAGIGSLTPPPPALRRD